MAVHEWARRVDRIAVTGRNCKLQLSAGSDSIRFIERATTETLDPPEGEGWYLTSKFGVGQVQSAGWAPPRVSGRMREHSRGDRP